MKPVAVAASGRKTIASQPNRRPDSPMDILPVTNLRNRRGWDCYDLSLIPHEPHLVGVDDQLHIRPSFNVWNGTPIVFNLVPVVTSEGRQRHRKAQKNRYKLIHAVS